MPTRKKIFLSIIFALLFFVLQTSTTSAVDKLPIGSPCSGPVSGNSECRSNDCEGSQKKDASGKTLSFCDCVTANDCNIEYGTPTTGKWECSDGAAYTYNSDYCYNATTREVKTASGINKNATPISKLTDAIFDSPATQAALLEKVKTFTPNLEITIPGVEFSNLADTTDEEGYLNIPWIGEYIVGVYTYALGIAAIIAAIMIIIAGVRWTTSGGNSEAIGSSKKRIGGALVGLLIAYLSYAVLNIINPGLTTFKSLKVKYIEREEILFGDNTMDETDDNTGIKNTDNASDAGFSEKFSECPIKMSSGPITKIGKNNKPIPDPTGNQSRKQEFVQKILDNKILTGDFSNRAMMAAEAASKCKIYFGTCGQGTTAIYALAGVNGSFGLNNKCLKQTCNMGGDPIIKKQTVRSVYSTKIGGVSVGKLLQGMMCEGVPVCKGAGWDVNWKEQCFTDPKAASNKLKELLKTTGKWDEEQWFNDLKPGDYYNIANWNSTCSPTHSAMFLGWKDKANHVAFEASGDAGNFFRISTRDFDKKGVVIIMIERPQDK